MTATLSLCLLVTAWYAFAPIDTRAETNRDYLNAGEIAGITAGSTALWLVGSLAESSARGDRPRWNSPFWFEASLQRKLGGKYYPDKTNFLDGTVGSAYTAVGGLVLLTAADLAWVDDDAGPVAGEDVFLYISGLAATKGITSLAKGTVRRARPMVVLEPELASRRSHIDSSFDNQSFFSGHTSSAFFASAFLNLRFRSIMRQELSAYEYRNWRWGPPAVLFSWASFVGWSRIRSYKHYFLDVVAGAATGILMAELFYALQHDTKIGDEASPVGASPLIQVSIRF